MTLNTNHFYVKSAAQNHNLNLVKYCQHNVYSYYRTAAVFFWPHSSLTYQQQ